MATTLVQTGIQFPDSSTQTTRAGWIPLTLYNATVNSVNVTGIPDAARAIRVVASMSYSSGPAQPTIFATNSSYNFSHTGQVSNFGSSALSTYTAGNFISPQTYYMPASIFIDIAYRNNPSPSIHLYNYFVTATNATPYTMLGTGSLSAASGYINGFTFYTGSGSVNFNNLVAQIYYEL